MQRSDKARRDKYANEGDVLARQGRHDEAIDVYNFALAINPQDVEVQKKKANAIINEMLSLAKIYREEERYLEAIHCYDVVLDIDKNHLVARQYKLEASLSEANVLTKQFSNTKARLHYQEALALDPDNATIKMASLYNDANDKFTRTEKRIETYKQILLLDANHLPSLIELGGLLVSLNREEDCAHRCIQHALALQPNNVDALNEMSNYHEKRKQFDEAIACQKKILALAPNDLLTNLRLDVLNGMKASTEELREENMEISQHGFFATKNKAAKKTANKRHSRPDNIEKTNRTKKRTK